jgi:hypothetical protein
VSLERGFDGRTQSAQSRFILLALGVLLASWSFAPGALRAETSPQPPPAAEEEPAAPAADEPFDTKVSIHGYLSQAYAQSDGNEIAGTTESGTADYRTAAIQIRAEVSPQDSFAVQFSHERLGKTGLQAFQEDVALDWIFYEHRFADGLAVKVGKVQIPFGIYNEVRDVGTLFPFYRPSSNFYGEGSYTSETVDGVVLSRSFQLGGSWRLDGDLHYGNWEFVSRSNGFFLNKVQNSRGVELWLQTPVSGLRIGAGGMRYDVLAGGSEDKTIGWKTYHVSAAWESGRVAAHAEYKKIDFGGGDYNAGYLHVGVNATDKLSIHGQIDRADLNIDFFRSGDFDDDHALAVDYAFRPDLVLKLEHHWNEGFTPEVPTQNFFAPAPKTRYWIASLSATF